MREISWREALTPLLAVLGLTFLLQDVVLSETLRKRILGPALGALFRELAGPYTTLYFGLAGLYFIAAIFVFLARPPRLPARATPLSAK